MKTPKSYLDLQALSLQIHELQSVASLLHWDQETYMPSGSITPRSHQLALMSELIHERKTSRKFKQLLSKLIHMSSGKPKIKGLTQAELAAVREWHKDYLKATKLPVSFVKSFSQLTSEASQIWSAAKESNKFKLFAPFLEKIIGMCREKAAILGFEEHPYDALLEGYEPCMTTRKVEGIFSGLQKELTALLKKIQSAPKVNDRFLRKKVDAACQTELGHMLFGLLPIDQAYSRLDLSAHPFSSSMHPHDSRITSRIIPERFMSHLFSILHETGHGLYEMHLPLKTWGTPLSEAVSLSIHESQSRWWETLIGRSLPFCKFLLPHLQKKLPSLKTISLDRFYRAVNAVEPSLIRVEADEVTYCLHVIVRFELEKDLITGSLAVSDLPDAWNEKMEAYLGIRPKNDREGCLQDIHWSLGDFGYFPTYALGNICAAQFFTTFAKDHSDWEKRVAHGDFIFIREWLKEAVHQWGRRYNSEELIKRTTGKPLNESAYCSYLKRKYAEIY